MLSDLRRFIGSIRVFEQNDIITIEGLDTEDFSKIIQKLWRSSRISRYMFLNASRSKVSFYSFFAVEVLYILKKLRSSTQKTVSKKAIDKIIEGLNQETWLFYTNVEPESIFDYRVLRKFEKRPLEHQSSFFNKYEKYTQQYRLNGFMLASPAGSGKTVTSLMIGEMLHADRIIVVCPKNAVYDPWIKSLNEEYTEPETDFWESRDRVPAPDNKRFYICHYEALDLLLPVASRFSREKVSIILDESHHMNEINAQRTKNFIELTKRTKAISVLWASGTPIKALGSEMIPFLESIDVRFNEKVKDQFKNIFGVSTERATDVLANRLGLSSHRIEKEHIVPGQPTHEYIYATPPDADRYTLESVGDEMRAFIEKRLTYYREHRKEYQQTYDRFIEQHLQAIGDNPQKRKEYKRYQDTVKWLSRQTNYNHAGEQMKFANQYEKNEIVPTLSPGDRKVFKDASSVIKYTPLKVRGECLGRILGKRRAEMVESMVPHLGLDYLVSVQKKKSLLFTNYVGVVNKAHEYFSEKDFKPISVHGETTGNLDAMIRSFGSDPKTNPAIATYQSLSTAVPLTMVSAIFLLNQPFRSYIREQAISRAHRLGQDAQVHVYHCMLDTDDQPNLSSRSFDIVEWSERQVNEIMGIEQPSQVTLESYGFEGIEHEQGQLPATFRW